MKKIAVIGSGLLGCLTAYKLAKKYPKNKIYLIDNADDILPSFKSVKINNLRLNNGFHALDIERSLDLYEFLKKKIKVKFRTVPTSRYLMINNDIIKENQKIINYPKNINKEFLHKKIITDNINLIYRSLSKKLQLLISKVSLRYSNNLKDNLKYFIPWFLPSEYYLKSQDEGDKYRNHNRIKNRQTFLAIPKNGLFENFKYYFKKKFKKINNITLLLNAMVIANKKKITISKKGKILDLNFSHIFFCTSSMIFISKKSKVYDNILYNKRFFVSCVVSSQSSARMNFSELLFLNKKFIEISRMSKIKKQKKNNLYLIEFSFKKSNNLKKQLNKARMKDILKPIFVDNAKSLKIIDYKITRLVFYPKSEDIKKGIKIVKKFVRNISSRNTKVFCNENFGPINMAKAWISSEANVKLLK